MITLRIKESELKSITLFLIEKKVLFHPVISPDGSPDFSSYKGRKFSVILDRNILTQLILLVKSGTLNDEFSLKMVSSIILWAQFNNIDLTSGIALLEYSHLKSGNEEANIENSLFLKAYQHYDPQVWLDLAVGKRKSIPQLTLDEKSHYNIYYESDHFKMHYLEMLKAAQMYYSNELSLIEKFSNFHQWIYDNILICRYTTRYFALLMKKKIDTFSRIKDDFDELLKACTNQAWDLSYLSLWITQHYSESKSQLVYLFATLDKKLKGIFISSHKESGKEYITLFGEKAGKDIYNVIESIYGNYANRKKPLVGKNRLDQLVIEETNNLKLVFLNRKNY